MNGERLGWAIVSIVLGIALALFVLFQYHTDRADAQSALFPDTSVLPTRIHTINPDLDGFVSANNQQLLPTDRVHAAHIATPASVRALYMSSWVAGTASARQRLIKTIQSEGVNAVVIDIKDATGYISYTGANPDIAKRGSYSRRIRTMPDILADLHQKNIYVIGRVSVFQDQLATKYDTANAVQNPDGSIWRDRKGISWMDQSSKKHWDYIIAIAREAYTMGFDEINLDYVRFPTDGVASDMTFPVSGVKPDKSAVIESFFSYISSQLRDISHIPLSADVFGLSTTVADTDGVGIGQRWVSIIPYVDFLCPMIYPSHYAANSFGYTNPADHPYQVITRALQGAIEKNQSIGEPITKIRPWIQDFNMGANYDAAKVQAQIQAGLDLGIDSYLSWDPSNRYTVGGYKQQ
jgi:hypothetical protein